MRKLLIGIHDKTCSMRAVAYVMRHYADVRDVEATLVHVIPDLPARYWDDGHILSPAEEAERARVIETWTAGRRDFIEPILQGAVGELVKQGFPAGRVRWGAATSPMPCSRKPPPGGSGPSSWDAAALPTASTFSSAASSAV